MSHAPALTAFHRMSAASSLPELLFALRPALSGPVLLADLTFTVLAVCEDGEPFSPRWDHPAPGRLLPPDLRELSQCRATAARRAPVVTQDPKEGFVIRCSVRRDDRGLGWLIAQCSEEPGEDTLDLLTLAAEFAALRMVADHHYGSYPADHADFFLASLLEGRITDEARVRDRCRQLGRNLPSPYQLLTLCPRSAGVQREFPSLRELEQAKGALREKLPSAVIFQYGYTIKLILPLTNRMPRDTLMLAELSETLSELGLNGGVSQLGFRLTGMALRSRQSEKALELATLLDSRETLFFYEKYSIYHCLELCSKEINLFQCCHPAVTHLERYDREHSTELLETLHAYLVANLSAAGAAEALHIHRNTLMKRLDRINDLCRIDLSDSETVFHLSFSYRIMEYYGTTVLRDRYLSWMERSPSLRHP